MRTFFSSMFFVVACVNGWSDVALNVDASTANQARVRVLTGGEIDVRTSGGDPYVFLRPFDPNSVSDGECVLAFEYFCPDGIDDLEVFYGPPIEAGRSVSGGGLGKAESWAPAAVDLRQLSAGRWSPDFSLLRLDFGRRSGVTIRLRDLQLRAPNETERMAGEEVERIRREKRTRSAAVLDYLERDFPAAIASVSVLADRVVVRGRVERDVGGGLVLVEVPMSTGAWERGLHEAGGTGSKVASLTAMEVADGGFVVRLPRFVDERDRIGARWAVAKRRADGFELSSRFAYASDLSGASRDLKPVEMPASRKGMAGVWANDILDELVELGVRHITANMPITSLLDVRARDGWSSFRHGGRTWWVNPGLIDGFDRLIRFATEHDIVVSAIILVPFGEGEFAKTLIHPEADRAGHYAMPNLTTEEGALAYESAIALLAGRYAQPGDPNGRITNWILHNEIDYGWEWTNMGRQPMPVYLETYIRSMRIVYNQVRRFNPQARVFISLTHSWNVEDDPGWKVYSPKRMLELLARFSKAEGDFEWGVAYHPYPQSLFRADAWNDTLPTFDFDTPMITPKNIEVLDRWMHTPEMLCHGGKLRGVLLSEQGFHTDGYSEAAMRLQGEAFVYMWEKMHGLDSIEVFHNHRWVDHPAEGGLRLGVRTLPTADHPYGKKKPAWEVYKRLEAGEPPDWIERPWRQP